MPNKLIGVAGLVVFLLIAWAMSENRKLFPWRTVTCGLALQFGFAVFILLTPWGKTIFGLIQKVFDKLLEASSQGTMFIFGSLGDGALMEHAFGEHRGFVFAIAVTGNIVIVSSFSMFLYHYGILQRAVHLMAVVMKWTMRTSGSESLAAAVNMFVGQTESALVIQQYLAGMTASEILALMTVGMATIASGIMVTYTNMGMEAGHLLTASVMSAPGALLIAKIMLPETKPSETASSAKLDSKHDTFNGIEALCRGAGQGMNIAINVMAMLIAFVAAVWLVNFSLVWVQGRLGVADPIKLETFLGWINAPFAWLMGMPWHDARIVGPMLGKRILLNEFVSYLDLSTLINAHKLNPQPGDLTHRSTVIATYALCGFANFSSIAIQIGGIGAIAPSRREDLARFGFKAMIGGLLTCYISATIAGLLVD
jgi:CNT family concentrative nucleoside transporter